MAPAAPGRACSKQTCNRGAVCTLTYVYADSTAVIGPLSARREPHAYDLCPVHADTLTAPRGWRVVRLESAADWEDSAPSVTPTVEETTDGAHGAPAGATRGVRVLRDVSYRGPREPDTAAPENGAPSSDDAGASPYRRVPLQRVPVPGAAPSRDAAAPAPPSHVSSGRTVPPADAVPGEDTPSEPAAAGGVERVGRGEYPGPTRSVANAHTQSEPLPRSVPLPDELRTPHWRRP